jgi:G:T/U-mismatch repair DNA glycosylase
MPAVTLNTFKEESHDWGNYIPEGATRLFIGTFPTDVSNRKHDFFYSSATNRFWDTISTLSGTDRNMLKGQDGIDQKRKILDKLKLGLTDMGKRVYRQMGSSNDHSLFPIEFMDIIQLLEDHPTINTLIVSGERSGNSSLSWFSTYCNLNRISLDLKKLKNRNVTDIEIAGRRLMVRKAYSPSRAARGISDDKLLENYKLIIQSTL